MQSLITSSSRRLETELLQWSEGEADADGFLDHDGVMKDQPVRIHVTTRKWGGRLTIDFTGSAPQGRGPVNMVSCTARAVSVMAILAASDPTIPVNAGLNDRVEFVFPEASVVNPQHPATINHYFPTAHLAYNTFFSLSRSSILSALWRLPAWAQGPSLSAIARRGMGNRQYSMSCSKPRLAAPARMTGSPW
jgi:N-methylhydantoinase B